MTLINFSQSASAQVTEEIVIHGHGRLFARNKIDRPNKTPTVRGICTFAVYFSVFRPFCRFTLVYEGHFVLCKEKIEPLTLDRAMADFKRS